MRFHLYQKKKNLIGLTFFLVFVYLILPTVFSNLANLYHSFPRKGQWNFNQTIRVDSPSNPNFLLFSKDRTGSRSTTGDFMAATGRFNLKTAITIESWRKSYALPPKPGKHPLVTVIFIKSGRSKLVNIQYCTLGDGRQSAAYIERLGVDEDRSKNHTILVHCIFDSEISGKYVNINTIVSKIYYHHFDSSNTGNSLCIPTFFGVWCRNKTFVQQWLLAYTHYYESKFKVNKFRIYTDWRDCYTLLNLFKKQMRMTTDLAVEFIAPIDSGAHYHNQRLATFDCFYRSLLYKSNWTFILDSDEVLQIHDYDALVLPDNIAAITFGSWRYDYESERFTGKHCSSFMLNRYQRFQNRATEKCEGGVSPCCRCLLGPRGRRKYAIRSNYFLGGSPYLIHEPIVRDGHNSTVSNLDAFSGIFLKHIDLSSPRNKADIVQNWKVRGIFAAFDNLALGKQPIFCE